MAYNECCSTNNNNAAAGAAANISQSYTDLMSHLVFPATFCINIPE